MLAFLTQKINSLEKLAQPAHALRSLPLQVFDWLTHRLLLNVSVRDYYRNRFYHPSIAWRDKPLYVCTDGSRYWPCQGNLLKYTETLKNKYIEKHLLLGFGLPTSPLLFSVGATGDVRDFKALTKVLEHCIDDLVIKPLRGYGGGGVRILENRSGQFFYRGEAISGTDLWASLQPGFDAGYLFEKRQHNCTQIRTLFPGCLNTFRIVTMKTRDGRWHAPACILKLGTGDMQADNIANGGIPVFINKEGVSELCYPGYTHITHHPDSGEELADVQIESYSEVIALALRASEHFNYLGSIGWDIASTEHGAMIIEGNTFWSSIPVPMLTGEICRGLKRHSCFSRWRRDAVHPNMGKASFFARLFA